MVILGIVLIVLGLLVVGLVLNIAPVGGTRRRFY